MTNKDKQTSKPKQRIPWASKVASKYKFFNETADYYISKSVFGGEGHGNNRTSNIQALRDIYASIYPKEWFKHVLDPYNTNKEVNHPGKIRPLNIIKPNIDYLQGEYQRRPFPIMVSLLGDQSYNSFIEHLTEEVYKSSARLFVQAVKEEAAAQGVPLDTGVEDMPVEDPAQTASRKEGSYKNQLAAQADIDLQLIKEDVNLDEKFEEQFADYLKVGEMYSFKDVIRDEVVYERVPPEEIDFGISPGLVYLKDGTWVVRRQMMYQTDILDKYYDYLTESDIKKIESFEHNSDATHTSEHLIAIYHCTWRSEEKVGIRTYFDEMTGEMEMDEVSETYVVDEESGETVEWIWRSRWLETTRIGDSSPIYIKQGKVRYAPNFINHLARTEGPYNGRVFSPDSSTNTSPLKLGIPFLISYILGHFALEKIIARGGNKIALIDQAVIPRSNGWDESKFFQFGEARGWGLINRNQAGVDKSYNQYQVLDLSMYDHISKIIEVMDFCQNQYDLQLGITRPAKGDTTQRDSATGNRIAVTQSSIVTEMIFSAFDRYKLTEYQGLLHCSQISSVNGKRRLYTSSDNRQKILDINPMEYCPAQLGVRAVINPLESSALEKMRAYGQSFAQNGVEASTILEIETARSIPKLRELLLETEKTRKEAEAAMQEAEAANEEKLLSLENEFKKLEASLDLDFMHQEYDRRQDLVILQGDINMAMTSVEHGGNAETANPALNAYMDYASKSDKIEKEMDLKNKARLDKRSIESKKVKIAEEDAVHTRKIKERESQAKIAAMKKKASQKPAAKSK